jgi:hypothetical protein
MNCSPLEKMFWTIYPIQMLMQVNRDGGPAELRLSARSSCPAARFHIILRLRHDTMPS